MITRRHKALAAMLGLLVAGPALAMEYLVEQIDREFLLNGKPVAEMEIKKGDTISFLNKDPYFHNIFSENPPNDFDLGAFPANTAESYTFMHEGELEVKCSMHDNMRIKIKVAPQ